MDVDKIKLIVNYIKPIFGPIRPVLIKGIQVTSSSGQVKLGWAHGLSPWCQNPRGGVA